MRSLRDRAIEKVAEMPGLIKEHDELIILLAAKPS
jgi:hypothetical protein